MQSWKAASQHIQTPDAFCLFLSTLFVFLAKRTYNDTEEGFFSSGGLVPFALSLIRGISFLIYVFFLLLLPLGEYTSTEETEIVYVLPPALVCVARLVLLKWAT